MPRRRRPEPSAFVLHRLPIPAPDQPDPTDIRPDDLPGAVVFVTNAISPRGLRARAERPQVLAAVLR